MKINSTKHESSQTNETSSGKMKKLSWLKARVVVMYALVLLLLCMAGDLIHLWTQNDELRAKLDQTNNMLRTEADQTNGQISALNKEIQELKLAYESVKAESTPNNLVELEGVLSAFHLDTTFMSSVGNNVTYGKDQRGYNTVYIVVAVINKGSEGGFISDGKFKLKDSKGVAYEMYTEQMRNRAELQGKQPLQAQTLAPGERTVGLIAFQVPAELKDAKLYYNDKVYDVSLTN